MPYTIVRQGIVIGVTDSPDNVHLDPLVDKVLIELPERDAEPVKTELSLHGVFPYIHINDVLRQYRGRRRRLPVNWR